MRPATAWRGSAGFMTFTLVMVTIFIGLGVWQLQRRLEKHALIAALAERIAAEPVPLPPIAQWSALNPAHDEFRRVTFTATYPARSDAMVYSAGSALREDISGPGTWAFLPARVAGGTVVVNAGFVENSMQARDIQDRAVAKLVTGRPALLTGYVRFPEHAGLLTPSASLAKRLWFVRDHEAMAHALGWNDGTGPVAPFYIDLEQPVPADGTPKPGPLTVHLRDEHMQYAITWFALAAMILIAFGAWLYRRGADRRLEAGGPG